MKILLTGGNGMVGRNILEDCHVAEYEFLVPTSIELNLRDKLAVDNYLRMSQPDMVIHSAGIVGGIQANVSQPVKFLVENMQMGLNIITAAYEAGVKRFMNMSSSCMYPRNALNPLAEELILQGELEPTNEGYALAKIASTRLCEYVNRENSNYLYKTIIPCNLYGRHDKFEPNNSHMVPAVIRKIDEAIEQGSERVEIWGDGEARREFMYAGDLADFVFYALRRFELMPQNINVGLGYDFSINEYYQEVAKVVGYKGNFWHNTERPVGMKQKVIDVRKLSDFGWESKTNISDGIEQTYKYYLEHVRK